MRSVTYMLIIVTVFGIIYGLMEWNPRILILLLFFGGLAGLLLYINKNLENG